MNRILNFVRANLFASISLLLYYIWWAYLVFVFNRKEYDDGNAAVIAVEFVVLVTCLIIGICSIIFIASALKTKKWKKYVVFILLLYVPVLLAYLWYSNSSPNLK